MFGYRTKRKNLLKAEIIKDLLKDKSLKSKLIIGTIEEIWQSEQMKFIRDIHQKGEYWKHPVCKKCVLISPS